MMFLAFIVLLFNSVMSISFISNVEIHKDNSVLKANVKYSSDLSLMITEYTDPISMIEIKDYKENVKYKYCSSCESLYLNEILPNISFVYSNNKITEFTLSNSNAIYKVNTFKENVDLSEFDYSYMSCPKPICKRIVDIVFVLDESGSIAEIEWDQLLDFCINLVNSYEIGIDAAQVAIVGYAGFGRLHLDLSYNKQTIINKLNDLRTKQLRGGTCTGCGLMIAKSVFDNAKNSLRTKNYNPEHLIFTITDGEVSEPDYTTCEKTTITSYYNYCVGCCNHKDFYWDGCWNVNYSSCSTNKTFTLSKRKCSTLDICTKGSGSYNGYQCSNCWCDSSCSYAFCDKCKLSGYAERCAIYKYDVEGCVSEYDGYVNCYTNFTESCKEIKKDNRLTSIAIGVGSYVDSQIKEISSNIQGIQTVFGLTDYLSLNKILSQLISETCSKVDLQEDCNSDCLGFCGCNRKCYCPKCIEYNESCIYSECVVDEYNIGSSGCVIKNIDCPINKCQTVKKNNNSVKCCEYSDIICNDNNICTKDYCDSNIGCVFIDEVEMYTDNNSCTIDKCENNFISHELIEDCKPKDLCHIVDSPCESVSDLYCKPATFKDKCSCNNSCEIPVCDIETGKCTCIKKDCETNNTCSIGYCLNGKCYQKENFTKINECYEMYKSDCSYGICNNSECVKVDIECSACQENKTFVSECESKSNACEKYKCKDINGEAVCEKYWEMFISSDLCLGEYCDQVEGLKNNPLIDYSENCVTYHCENGEYKKINNCKENSICLKYECLNNSCVSISNCPEYEIINGKINKCKILKYCDEIEGCIYENIECKNGNCYESYCNPETGKCEKIDNSSNCFGDDLCSIYSCVENIGCVIEDKNCTGKDPCYLYSCNNETGNCEKVEKCKNDDLCLDVVCSLSGICIYENVICPESNNSCFYYECENGTCIEKFKSDSFLDICGKCISDYGDIYNISSSGVCIGSLTSGEFSAIIGGAAVAGIVIAAIIVAAAIGVSTTYGVKELINRSKLMDESAINNNPLYESKNNEFDNPTYMSEI